MRALFIGGTGIISTSVSRLAVEQGWDLTLLNRGSKPSEVSGARQIVADMADEEAVAKALGDARYDVAVDFIAFSPEQAQRDIRLFQGKCGQYIFISTASVYHKPLPSPIITESTALSNPYWIYSQKKLACEDVLMQAYRAAGFPVTIVRPSHTFAPRSITVPVHGKYGFWQVLQRMRAGKKILVPGDGNTLWAVMTSEDFARAFLGLMGNVHAIGEAVQIASEELLTWNQILQIIARALQAEYRPCYVPSTLLAKTARYDFQGALLGDKSNTVIFDNAKLKRLVPGFQARKRFDQAAPEFIAYLLAHPQYQIPDPEFDAFCDQVVAVMERTEKEIAAI